jgi:hypothetical protein
MIKRGKEEFVGLQPRTFDFTTMYTCLQHDQIKTNIKQAVQEASSFQDVNETGDNVIDDEETLLNLVNFIVDNTFLANVENVIIRQKIGLPMGTNCAPEIANLTLYAWESNFIDNLLINNSLMEAKLHARTKRYIDDLLLFNCEPPQPEAYGNLQYSEQTKEDGSVTYLGAKIYLLTNQWMNIEVFDKTLEWKFNIVRYPHALTNAPKHQTKGIFIGQLQRYRTICNSIKGFKKATTQLTFHMIKRKHPVHLITLGWQCHLMKFNTLINKHWNKSQLNFWFRKMMYWALKKIQHDETRPFTTLHLRQQPTPSQQHLLSSTQPNLSPYLLSPSLSLSQQPSCSGGVTTRSSSYQDAILHATTPTSNSNIILNDNNNITPSQQLIPPNGEPFSENLFITHANTFDGVFKAKIKKLLETVRKRQLNAVTLGTVCTKCWQSFHRLTKHSEKACQTAADIRSQILQLLLRNSVSLRTTTTTTTIIEDEPQSTTTHHILWCMQHCVNFYRLTPIETTNNSHCLLLTCPTCGPAPAARKETALYNTVRLQNDCGFVAVNSIIFQTNHNNNLKQPYLSHHHLQSIGTEQFNITSSNGMMYEQHVLTQALITHCGYKQLIPFYNPQEGDQQSILLYDNTEFINAILIRPPSNNMHYYTFLYNSKKDHWTISDSSYRNIHTFIITTQFLKHFLLTMQTHQDAAVVAFASPELTCSHNTSECTNKLYIQSCGFHRVCENCTQPHYPFCTLCLDSPSTN